MVVPAFPFHNGTRGYQIEALNTWKENGCRGLFAMDTSTDKTIKALNCLFDSYSEKRYLEDLPNRYLHINPTTKWKVQSNLDDRTSAGQVQDKCDATDDAPQDKVYTDNPNIARLLQAVGEQQMSVKSMMEALGLKGRDNFLNLYLKPAISSGYIRLLYPDSSRHPRQKYILTVKGLMLYKDILVK